MIAVYYVMILQSLAVLTGKSPRPFIVITHFCLTPIFQRHATALLFVSSIPFRLHNNDNKFTCLTLRPSDLAHCLSDYLRLWSHVRAVLPPSPTKMALQSLDPGSHFRTPNF